VWDADQATTSKLGFLKESMVLDGSSCKECMTTLSPKHLDELFTDPDLGCAEFSQLDGPWVGNLYMTTFASKARNVFIS